MKKGDKVRVLVGCVWHYGVIDEELAGGYVCSFGSKKQFDNMDFMPFHVSTWFPMDKIKRA